MSPEYTTNPEQTVILRGDVIVADIVDGKCKMRPEHRKYAIGAGKFWKAYTLQRVAEKLAPLVAELGKDPLGSLDLKTVDEYFERVDAPDFRLGNGADIPPCPPMDPAMGTKSPDVAEWYRRYHPDKWASMHVKWRGR